MSLSLERHSVQVCHREQKLRASLASFELLFPSPEIKFKVEGWRVGTMGKHVPQVEKQLPSHSLSVLSHLGQTSILALS